MTVAIVVDRIQSLINDLGDRGAIYAYLFGSARRADSAWSDIDILIVCDTIGDGQFVRVHFSKLCLSYPVDLLVMTSEEEAEFDFIHSEGCQLIATNRQSPSESHLAALNREWSRKESTDMARP